MVDKYKMDGHKLMYHGERIKDLQTGKRIAPLYIDMGITLTCNIACEYCYYAVPENKSRTTKDTVSPVADLSFESLDLLTIRKSRAISCSGLTMGSR